MRFYLSVFSIIIGFQLNAQIGTGQWRMHVAASKAIDIACGNGLVMTALSSGLLEYDISANETKVYDNLNGLSDITLSTICYEPSTKSFFVGYENGNIDQILESGSVINIPGIKLAQITADKRINEFTIVDGKVFAATGFAIVILDPIKHEVKDTYYPSTSNQNYTDLVIAQDTIFALTADKLYKAFKNNAFLTDPSQWQTDARVPIPSGGTYFKVDQLNDELYLLYKKDGYGGDSLMKITNFGLDMIIGTTFSMEITDFEVRDNKLQLLYEDNCIYFNTDATVFTSVDDYNGVSPAPKAVELYQGSYWVADNKFGLTKFNGISNFQHIRNDGPPKNNFFSVNGNKGKLIVTGGILDRVIFNYHLYGAYSFKDETWKTYDKSTQPLWNTAMTWDIGVAAVNPKNIDEVAFASYSIDPLSITANDQVATIYNSSNSPLEQTTLGNGNTCISALEYDEDGNLWLTNCYSNKPLKVRKTDGNWVSFETGSDSKAVYTSKLVIDDNGNKWFGLYEKGLVAFNDNGTIDNTSDDTYRILKTGSGSGNLPSNNVTAIAADLDNEIWIGTDDGFVVLYNSEGVFSSGSSVDASRILVNFEGNVEQLLDDTPIVDIEIDGGNRKWIATGSTGIFLLTADGQEVISHFTKENSPLISNNILDMEFDYSTGELFIVTDIGLVSYRSDASVEDETYETTTVFPNPVKPDFFGPITIQGIRYDSDVKITDVAGNLVYKTTSNGGTATWNGKTISGENVASGVYLIWTATNEAASGKDKKVGKVVVIR